MPGGCLSLLPSEECARSIAKILRWSDLVQLSIYLGLALMLAYTFFVVLRFLHRCHTARRQLFDFERGTGTAFRRNGTTLIADWNRELGTLRGIAYAAPFLGLAGTSYGILAAPSWFHYRGINGLFEDLAGTLINTAFGILVAFSATLSYNVLRTCVEALSRKLLPKRNLPESDLGSFQHAQTLPLRRRLSGPPHFALIVSPALAFLVLAYVAFKPYPMPTGLSVHVLPIGSLEGDDEAGKVVISLLSRVNDIPVVRVNSKEVPWGKLEDVVQETLHDTSNPQAFVEADSEVLWTHVAYVIDTLKRHQCRVILLTTSPARKPKQRNPCRSKVSQSCGSVN